jgi:ankyrin repeat protein
MQFINTDHLAMKDMEARISQMKFGEVVRVLVKVFDTNVHSLAVVSKAVGLSGGQLRVLQLLQMRLQPTYAVAAGVLGLPAMARIAWRDAAELYYRLEAADSYGDNPLVAATLNSDAPAVRGLLSAGVLVDGRNRKGQTALMLASNYGCMPIVEALLAAKADCNATTAVGRTALHEAAATNRSGIVTHLLNAHADVSSRTTDGKAALHMAVAGPSDWVWPDIVALLIDAKADVNMASHDTEDAEGLTPLQRLCGHYPTWTPLVTRLAAIQLLLEAKADVNARTTSGKTALTLAHNENVAQIVQRLKAVEAVV